eukprot:TRINITY_DN81128_c0_g1_i1.p1 TRINITY_DN81128_c0_g1~~TRINITY_DN81128_c0_g1_i1.p1  ORF type:complete len:217 (+),score=14.88 TRINITY_DN81128_c0_g1_i1:60-710(+)
MDCPAQKRARTDGDSDPVVTLDIGGARRRTRQSTLTWSSRYFRNIFEGPFRPEEGELFLDCDIAIFDHLLYYFRHHRLPQDVPSERVRDVANMYSVEELVEEMDRRLESERLIGSWHYEVEDGGGCEFKDDSFVIYEKERGLWYHEYLSTGEGGQHNHGPLKKVCDYYIVKEQWGIRLLRPVGHTLLFCELELGEDIAPDQATVLAIRKMPTPFFR